MFEKIAVTACVQCGLEHHRRIPCSVAIEAAKKAVSGKILGGTSVPLLTQAKNIFSSVAKTQQTAPAKKRKKKTLTAAARKKLSDAAKAKWAKWRETQQAKPLAD